MKEYVFKPNEIIIINNPMIPILDGRMAKILGIGIDLPTECYYIIQFHRLINTKEYNTMLMMEQYIKKLWNYGCI